MLEGLFFILFFASLAICASFGPFMECQESRKPWAKENKRDNLENSMIQGRPVEVE